MKYYNRPSWLCSSPELMKCFENDNDSVGRVWSRICASTSKVQVSGGDGTYQVSTGYSIFSATPLGFIYAKNKDHAVKDANVLFSGLCGSEGKIRVLFYSYKGRDFASLKNCQLLAEPCTCKDANGRG